MDTKQIRDFIKSHEMRYYALTDGYGENRTYIKKAYKVKFNDQECWVSYDYGNVRILSQDKVKRLVKTMPEVKKQADIFRKRVADKKRENAENFRKNMDIATDFIDRLGWYQLRDMANGNEKGKKFVKMIKWAYASLPKEEQDDGNDSYVEMLERYVRYGTFVSQTLVFTKEQVVKIQWGERDAIEITLADGTRFIPVNERFVQLIKLVFGGRGNWHMSRIKWPDSRFDQDTTDD